MRYILKWGMSRLLPVGDRDAIMAFNRDDCAAVEGGIVGVDVSEVLA